MAFIDHRDFPLITGPRTVTGLPGGIRFTGLRFNQETSQGRVFFLVPFPNAAAEERKVFVVQAGTSLPGVPQPNFFDQIPGQITTTSGADWFVFERVID